MGTDRECLALVVAGLLSSIVITLTGATRLVVGVVLAAVTAVAALTLALTRML